MKKKPFHYEIGGRTFIQRKLVLGQVQQLIRLLAGVEFAGPLDILSVIYALGNKFPQAVAICITEEGASPRDKNVGELAPWIEYEADIETTVQVVEDFFTLNPTSSVLKILSGLVSRVKAKISGPTTSDSSSASSPEAISQNGTRSSGDTP